MIDEVANHVDWPIEALRKSRMMALCHMLSFRFCVELSGPLPMRGTLPGATAAA
jgi:hypothetical protein